MRKFLKSSFLSIQIFFAVLLLLSYLAPKVNPNAFWPIAFLGMAFLPLFVINLLFFLWWAIQKRYYALISLIALVMGWGTLKDHFGFNYFDKRPAAGHEESLRVLSYNVHLFRAKNQASSEPSILEDVYQLVDENAPSIVCLQEFYTRHRGKYQIAEHFKTQLGLPHQYFHPVAKNEHESYGLAIFSKFPIVGSGHLPAFENGVNSIIFADIQYKDTVIRVYNVHLRSFGFVKEDYDFIRKPTGTIETDMAATRKIGSRLKSGFQVRSEQALSLKDHLSQVSTPYIIMGDFNDTPLSFAVGQVKKGLKNTFLEKGRGWGVTYNGDFPNFQIDYIFNTLDFAVADYGIIKKKSSDHYPVWADLSLQSE